jgi:CubicO group peptidase (beta-lactamase class C family)
MLLNGGTFKAQKIIAQESIDMMTRPYSKDEDNGFEIGFSFFVLTAPDRDGTNSPKGIYGWSGAHNTHFWIDPQNNLFGLFMTRARDFSFEISKDFRRAVYASLNGEK